MLTATHQPQMNLPHPKKKTKTKQTKKQWIAQAYAWQQYNPMACNVFLFWHFEICRCPIKLKCFPAVETCLTKSRAHGGIPEKRSHLLGSTWYQIDATYVSLRRTNSLSWRFSWNVVYHNTTDAVFPSIFVNSGTDGINYRVLLLFFVFYLSCRRRLLIRRQITVNCVPRSGVVHVKCLAGNQTEGAKYIWK